MLSEEQTNGRTQYIIETTTLFEIKVYMFLQKVYIPEKSLGSTQVGIPFFKLTLLPMADFTDP